MTAYADRGCYSGWEVRTCARDDIMPYVPKPPTSDAKFEGRFGKQDYVYMPGEDVYRCPAGELLTWRYNRDEAGKVLRSYWTTKCQTSPIKLQCTPSPRRRINRWKHEDFLDAMQRRLDQMPQAMRHRRQTVEHPFGTIKAWMGATHFLTKTLKRVRTEINLQVIAYNMKRVVAIMA